MIRPIEANGPFIYAQSEFFQEEADNRRQAKKALALCVATISLMNFRSRRRRCEIIERFWIDRVGGIRLARVQTYDERGRLITDVSYHNEKTLGSSMTASLPSRVEITRPQDQYKLSISYQDSASVELNRELWSKGVCVGKQVAVAGSRSRRSEQESHC